MNPNRMTIEELLELKPSLDNPIDLICDDDFYDAEFGVIRVIYVYRDRISVITQEDRLSVLCDSDLRHYPSLKQPKKHNLEVFCEAFAKCGIEVTL